MKNVLGVVPLVLCLAVITGCGTSNQSIQSNSIPNFLGKSANHTYDASGSGSLTSNFTVGPFRFTDLNLTQHGKDLDNEVEVSGTLHNNGFRNWSIDSVVFNCFNSSHKLLGTIEAQQPLIAPDQLDSGWEESFDYTNDGSFTAKQIASIQVQIVYQKP